MYIYIYIYVLCEIDLFVYLFMQFLTCSDLCLIFDGKVKSDLLAIVQFKIYHTVETVPLSYRRMIERGKTFLSR